MPKRYVVTRGPSPTPGTCTLVFSLREPDPADTCPDLPASVEANTNVCNHFEDPRKLWECAEIHRILDHSD